MDINILRGIMTGLLIIIFIGIYAWAYSSKRKDEFDEAAMLPFGDDDKELLRDFEPQKNKPTVSNDTKGEPK